MKKFIKQNQKPISAFLFFILLTSISAFVYFTIEPKAINNTDTINNIDIQDDINIAEVEDIVVIENKNDILQETTPTKTEKTNNQEIKPEAIPENIEIYYFTVDGEEYNISMGKNKELTVYELMQLLTASSQKPFFFQTKEFAGMGHFIESINGIKNNPKENEYWIYYINGESANMGISQYKIQPSDKIEWKFEESTL